MQFDRRKLLVWCVFAFAVGFGGGYGFVHGKLDAEAATKSTTLAR